MLTICDYFFSDKFKYYPGFRCRSGTDHSRKIFSSFKRIFSGAEIYDGRLAGYQDRAL